MISAMVLSKTRSVRLRKIVIVFQTKLSSLSCRSCIAGHPFLTLIRSGVFVVHNSLHEI